MTRIAPRSPTARISSSPLLTGVGNGARGGVGGERRGAFPDGEDLRPDAGRRRRQVGPAVPLHLPLETLPEESTFVGDEIGAIRLAVRSGGLLAVIWQVGRETGIATPTGCGSLVP